MKKAKRFYKEVSVTQSGDGYSVKLDTRELKTPGRSALVLCKDHAHLLAGEWQAQGEHIRPETMPVTRLLNVAAERTPINRDALIAEAAKYAGTDLLSYRSEDRPLFDRQSAQWDPVLDWVKTQHDVKIKTTVGIVAIEQDPQALSNVANYAADLNDIDLTLMVHFTAVFGSAILALAVLDGHLDAKTALDLSRLDEIFQIERWGQDEEAEERTNAIYKETAALARLLRGTEPGPQA